MKENEISLKETLPTVKDFLLLFLLKTLRRKTFTREECVSVKDEMLTELLKGKFWPWFEKFGRDDFVGR